MQYIVIFMTQNDNFYIKDCDFFLISAPDIVWVLDNCLIQEFLTSRHTILAASVENLFAYK